MPDCLCSPTESTSFRDQVRGLITSLAHGLICPKSKIQNRGISAHHNLDRENRVKYKIIKFDGCEHKYMYMYI
jgi:hypothetical protein